VLVVFTIDGVASLPSWLVLGVALAVAFAVLAAVAFVTAESVFANPRAGRARSDSGRSSEHRRRTEIRTYLDAIDEPYTEDHVVADRTVAFFLPDRDVAVTFDARTYFRLEGSSSSPRHGTAPASADTAGTSCVLCEHEMHGYQLGARLPFEVPDVDLYEPSNHDAVAWAAYDTLGLAPGAPEDAVREAYRDQVTDAHPDHGGTEAEFRALRDAYEVAKAHASGEHLDERHTPGTRGRERDVGGDDPATGWVDARTRRSSGRV
jgi:predicted outer membrane lipoprotein